MIGFMFSSFKYCFSLELWWNTQRFIGRSIAIRSTTEISFPDSFTKKAKWLLNFGLAHLFFFIHRCMLSTQSRRCFRHDRRLKPANAAARMLDSSCWSSILFNSCTDAELFFFHYGFKWAWTETEIRLSNAGRTNVHLFLCKICSRIWIRG